MATRTTTKTTDPSYKKHTTKEGQTTEVSNNNGKVTTKVTQKSGDYAVRVVDNGKTYYKTFDKYGKETTGKSTTVNATQSKVQTSTSIKDQMDKIPFKNKDIEKIQGTRGKSYVILGGPKGRTEMYGTVQQQDSVYAADNLWNDVKRTGNIQNPKGVLTKQAYAKDPAKWARLGFTDPKKIAALPDYVPPKNTNSGPLVKISDVKNAAGYGTCGAGYKLDSKGDCVRIRGYVQP